MASLFCRRYAQALLRRNAPNRAYSTAGPNTPAGPTGTAGATAPPPPAAGTGAAGAAAPPPPSGAAAAAADVGAGAASKKPSTGLFEFPSIAEADALAKQQAIEKAARAAKNKNSTALKVTKVFFLGMTILLTAQVADLFVSEKTTMIDEIIGFRNGAPPSKDPVTFSNDGTPLPPPLLPMKERVSNRFNGLIHYFNDPLQGNLLPDLPPPEYARPYTLLVELKDLLIHSEYTSDRGYVTTMRHGVPEFLRTLSDQYEIVIFTREPSTYAMPIIDKMDSEGYIWYRLYRDFTRHEKGEYYKDLTNLNRDLRRVILLDTRADASKTHPENVVVAPKWDGKSMDFWLLDLIPFLQTLASTRTTDVRPILTSYQGTDIPSAFAENQKRLEAEMELRRAQQAQQAQLQASKPQLTPPAFGGAGGSVNPWRR